MSTEPSSATAPKTIGEGIEGYYKIHAAIYDATRWTFLFGRNAILHEIPSQPRKILEVGCGTGKNLAELRRYFPGAELTGVDLSADMLNVARKKLGEDVNLVERSYDSPMTEGDFDLVLFSYALTMFNPGFETAIAAAAKDLKPGGHIAVVDFHDSRFNGFESWMGMNHVRMNAQLQPILEEQFEPVTNKLCNAYGFVWRYLMFVGQRPN